MRNHITLCINNALKFQQTMSKSIYSLIAIIALCILTHSNSQAQSYKMGDNLLNVGIGVGVYSYGGLPIGASFEHGFTEQISAGGFIDYLSWKNSYSSYNYSWRFIYFGARVSYHFNELLNLNNDKLDVYAGAGLGYSAVSTSDNLVSGYSGYSNRLFLNLHVGGRYYFSNNIGAYAEAGYGVSALKLGLTFKFYGFGFYLN